MLLLSLLYRGSVRLDRQQGRIIQIYAFRRWPDFPQRKPQRNLEQVSDVVRFKFKIKVERPV